MVEVLAKHQAKLQYLTEMQLISILYHHYFNIPHGTDVAELTRKLLMEKKWYQIYTKSNAEKKLYNKIIANGFQAFLPLKTEKKQWCDRVKSIEVPVLKSYLFAKLTTEEMNIVERLTGFCFFVTFDCLNKNSRHSVISYPDITDKTIELINIILTEYPKAIWQTSTLVKANKVEFIAGSLTNYKGVLIHHSSETVVAIKLPGLEQSFIINVPMAQLKKIT